MRGEVEHELKEATERVRMRSDGDGGFEADRDDEGDDEDEHAPLSRQEAGGYPRQHSAHVESSKIGRAAGGKAHPYKPKSTKITINMDGNENSNSGRSPRKSRHNGRQQQDSMQNEEDN